MQLHIWHSATPSRHKPTQAEIDLAWQASTSTGEIPSAWDYLDHGGIEQTWCGWALTADTPTPVDFDDDLAIA